MIQIEVHYILRKGMGPDWLPKVYSTGFDDLTNFETDAQIRNMAEKEFELKMLQGEDYRLYGKNWKITETLFS